MPISEFLSRLQAAERAVRDRLISGAPSEDRIDYDDAQTGPRYHRLIDARPRGPRAYLTPPSFRQPVVPLTQAGIFRRYELQRAAVLPQNLPNNVLLVPVPPGVIWRIISLQAVYTCDGTVNTRGVVLFILPDAGSDLSSTTISSQSDLIHTAGQSGRHTWMSGGGNSSAAPAGTGSFHGQGFGSLPERMILYEGARLGVSPAFGGFGVGDTISFVEIYVEEWTTFAGTAR